jgi:hypothetical protein
MKKHQKDHVRDQLLSKLSEYGVEWDFDSQKLIVDDLRFMQNRLAQHTNSKGLKYEEEFKNCLAKPEEINILKINPYLEVVNTQKQRELWTYATSFWSIPVTTGYGRRIRFLVFDEVDQMLDPGFLADANRIVSECAPGRQMAMFSATVGRVLSRV